MGGSVSRCGDRLISPTTAFPHTHTQVYIMGSYKLNVHEPGADIDLCCVVPIHVGREDFFGSLQETLRYFFFGGVGLAGQGAGRVGVTVAPAYQPPHITNNPNPFQHHQQRKRAHPRVKDLSAAATAHVPIMSFSLDGVEFDALFAQLPLPSVKVSVSRGLVGFDLVWFVCVYICIHVDILYIYIYIGFVCACV